MKRTHVLIALALGGLAAALLLPNLRRPVAPAAVMQQTPTPSHPALAAGSLTLTARPARHAFLASGDDLDVVYELTAAASPDTRRAPVDFALVFDRSGSMGGEPLAKAKVAARSLVSRLTEADRLAIVHFGSNARLALELVRMDPAGRRQATAVIDGIEADGGTNMSDALLAAERALQMAGEREGAIRRVVLLSDGQANEGLLGRNLVRVASQLGGEGMRVSALGLGVDFDEDSMLAIADAGGGQYRFLRDADEVATALARELTQAAATAATAIKLTLEPAEGIEIREVLGYDDAGSGARTLGLSDIAAGETRRIVLRVHAREGSTGNRPLVQARLAYDDVLAGHKEAAAEALAQAEATQDSARIAGSYDKEAAKVSLRARWGMRNVEAARKYEKNDVKGAAAALEDAFDTLRAEAAAIGEGGLAEEMQKQRVEAVRNFASMPAASDSGRGYVKTLKNFGNRTEGF